MFCGWRLNKVSLLYVKEFVVEMALGKYLVEVVAVGVGNKDLSEVLAGNDSDDVLNPLRVEFVEDIVEKEYGTLVEEVELCQFEGNDVGLCLSLAGFALHGVSADEHLEVVLVDAMQGVTHNHVLVPVALYHLKQAAPLAMGQIAQGDIFVFTAYLLIYIIKDRYEAFYEVVAALVYLLAVGCHLFFPQLHERHVAGPVFLGGLLQKGIALLKGFVVPVEVVDIGIVVLRDDDVEEAPALLAAAGDDGYDDRRYPGWRFLGGTG